VNRIADEIKRGRWHLNGDTIKFATSNDVLDGQHRLWAIIEANTAVESYVVTGIDREAFSTIDTLRAPRSAGDVIALAGCQRYRNVAAAALVWLIRYQRKVIENYREPSNRVENADVQDAYIENSALIRSVEIAMTLKGVVTPSLFAFLHYVITTRSPEIAARMVSTMSNPSGIGMTDPFFKLREWLLRAKVDRADRDPLVVIALTIKAANLAAAGKTTGALRWQNQGQKPEPFPLLDL